MAFVSLFAWLCALRKYILLPLQTVALSSQLTIESFKYIFLKSQLKHQILLLDSHAYFKCDDFASDIPILINIKFQKKRCMWNELELKYNRHIAK